MNKKIKFIIPCIIVLITISISIIISISKEKVMTTNKAVSGIAIYVNNGTSYVSQSSVPTGSYYLNTTLSHCVAKGEINFYNSSTGAVDYSFGGSDRCYLYFDQGTITVQKGVASEQIISLGKNNSSNVVYDDYGNVRYIGTNPDNYACFDDGVGGCINYNKTTGVETSPGAGLFRIIGVFNEDTHGQVGKKLVKVITADNYSDSLQWNDTSDINWSGSTLRTTLNSTYLTNSFTSGQQALISNTVWKSGAINNINIVSAFYEEERGLKSNDFNSATSKIGLINLSDIGYATSGSEYNTRDVCLNSRSFFWDYDYSDCGENDWIFYTGSRTGSIGSMSTYWLINPDYGGVKVVYASGPALWYTSPTSSKEVRPAFFFDYDVYIIGGSGTSTDPYRFNDVYANSNTTATTAIEELADIDKINLAEDSHGSYTNTRFIGDNPNNYACFSDGSGGCINYDKDDVEDKIAGLFRIIGVFNEDTHGVSGTKLLKVTSADGIKVAFDYKEENVGSSTAWDGSNDWSDSQLMYMLNGFQNTGYSGTTALHTGYSYNSSTYYISDGTNNIYQLYNGKSYLTGNGVTSLNKPASVTTSAGYTSSTISNVQTLTTVQINMIETITWKLGGLSDPAYAYEYYTAERGTMVYSGRPTKWTGKIGLMYGSDYAYATSNRTLCLNLAIGFWQYYADCRKDDWLDYINSRTNSSGDGLSSWTISSSASDSYYVATISWCSIGAAQAFDSYSYARPTFYLKSNVKIEGGTGTSTDPYRFTM